jgi:hypothetical protein
MAWLFQEWFTARWRSVWRRVGGRSREARQRDRHEKRAKSVAELRVLESLDENPPPLSNELNAKLRGIVANAEKRDVS